MNKFNVGILLGLLIPCSGYAFFPLNIFQPYDINLRPEIVYGKDLQFTAGYEGGFDFAGFQDDENTNLFCYRTNVLQLYQDNVNALAMLKGFGIDQEAGLLGQQFNLDADDILRGRLIPFGEFDVSNIMLSARWHLPYNLTLGFHIPYVSMKLDNVCFVDATRDKQYEDFLVREFLTSNFIDYAERFGDISLGGWKREGFGDLVTMLTWLENFPQMKPALKNVRLIVRGALSWPTGVEQDEDLLLALPFGNDGTVGLIFGAGLDLTFANYLRAGGYIELLYQFGNDKVRRIKTAEDQTDLFYLRKALTYREYGINEQFNLYLEGFHFWDGLSARFTYQFYKKRDDRLWLYNDIFDPQVVNSAGNLLDATYHNVIFFLKYDMDPQGYYPLSPQLLFFAKHGFNGKRAILGNSLGLTLTINF